MAEKLGYRPALDGLRAIAIGLVIGIHGYGSPADGQLGVDLFFVLSGFLITTLLLEEKAKAGCVSLPSFYVRRIRRLMPALTVLVVIWATVAVVRDDQPGTAIFSAASGLGFTMNVVRAWNLHAVSNGVGHLWSLGTEDQFYLVWPPILFLILRGSRALAAGALVLLLAGMLVWAHILIGQQGESIRVELGPDTRATGLPIGCLLAIAFFSPKAWKVLSFLARLLLPVAVFAAGAIAYGEGQAHVWAGVATGFDLACALILVRALDSRSWTAKALSLLPLVWVGRISYSLYLWHFPILDWTHWEGLGGWRATAAVAMGVAAASASYYLVEHRFRRRRHAPAPLIAAPLVAESH